jgi:uncharacterized membrane protein YkvA (DUF1232 family)
MPYITTGGNMQKRSAQEIVPSQGGVLKDMLLRIKLIVRLIGDRRVNPWLKLVPIAGVLYLLSPLDLIPDIALPVIGQLDDVAILWLTNHFFIEFCPPDVVREHVRQLVSNSEIIDEERDRADEVIDGEATDITNRK